MNLDFFKNKIVLISGPMYSGKSRILIQLYNSLLKSGNKVEEIVVVKPAVDTRTIELTSRNIEDSIKANMLLESKNIPNTINRKTKFLLIDEYQFFDENFINVLSKLKSKNITIFLSGLDLDYKKDNFVLYTRSLDLVDHQIKTTAICFFCNKISFFSKRVINKNNKDSDSQILIENDEVKYYSVCLDCHKT